MDFGNQIWHTGAVDNAPGQSYLKLNRVLLALAAACLLLPAPFMAVWKDLPVRPSTCPSLTWLGKPCPMCGLTRGFSHILHGRFAEATSLNGLSIPLFALLFLEALYRSALAFRRTAPVNSAHLARADLRIHLWLAAFYLVYAMGFILTHW